MAPSARILEPDNTLRERVAELVNEFSWSKSRKNMFHNCPRQYYFHYYGSWGGWKNNAPERTRALYVLKKLHNHATWIGVRIHEIIEEWVKHWRDLGQEADPARLLESYRQRLHEDWATSLQGNYWQRPKTFGLLEHEYRLDLPEQTVESKFDELKRSFQNFLNSTVAAQIRQVRPSQWLEIEDLSHFYWKQTKIFVSLDCSFWQNDQVFIYDWKSGSRSNDHSLQVYCYAEYLKTAYSIPVEKMRLIEFRLPSQELVEYLITRANRDRIEAHVAESITSMKARLRNPQENVADEEDFPLTNEEARCRLCCFRKCCPKWNPT